MLHPYKSDFRRKCTANAPLSINLSRGTAPRDCWLLKVLRIPRVKTSVKFILDPRSCGGSDGVSRWGTDSFGSHPSDTPGYNPFELQSSSPLPPDTPLRSIRREIEHLLKVRKDDAAARAVRFGIIQNADPLGRRGRAYLSKLLRAGSLKFMIPQRKLLRGRPKCFPIYTDFNLSHSPPQPPPHPHLSRVKHGLPRVFCVTRV